MADPDLTPEILPEATAKRRLLVYTLLRLVGLVVLAAGILRVSDGADFLGVIFVIVGAASLFIRPKLLASVFGSRW